MLWLRFRWEQHQSQILTIVLSYHQHLFCQLVMFGPESLTQGLYPRRRRKMGSHALLSVSPFWQGDIGSAQTQTGSGPGSTDADTPLSQAGKHARWTNWLLCLKLWVIGKNLVWHPQTQSNQSSRFRILLKSRQNKWQNTWRGGMCENQSTLCWQFLVEKQLHSFLFPD